MNENAIIDAIIRSLRSGATKISDSHLNRYDLIRSQLQQVDVDSDAIFQATFSGLFQLRWMPRQHRPIYFGMMQQQKNIVCGHSFRDLLQAYQNQTGRWDVSFITKLIAIIDPNRIVWDSLVSRRLGLSLPVAKDLEICDKRYKELSERMIRFLEHQKFARVLNAFDERFPGRDYKPMRILDAAIWGLG
jgi:hypothetical protein